MTKTALQITIIAIILILAQVIVFNHVCLFGVAVPIVFIYVILRLPVTLSREWTLTIAFFLGLIVDIFSDTQGMNSLACTISAALRRPVLHLYYPRDDELTDPCPSISTLGIMTYAKFALSMSLLYCTLFFAIEAFSFHGLRLFIFRILGSTILTTALILGIDCLTISRREKRL